ncbi:MAG: hypothetical protein ABIR92_09840 [Gemmatimonadaceae bacterium]
MGCLLRLGCLVVLLIGGIGAYLTRDKWMDRLPGRSAPTESSRTTRAPGSPSAPSSDGVVDARGWAPLTEAGATRTRAALQTLSGPRGPVFVTLSGSDVASYVFLQIAKQMPASTDSFAARVDNDHIRLRARMKTSELGSSVLGVLGSLLGDRERVEMGGTLRVIGKGVAEFRVDDVKVRDISLPDAIITRMVRPLVRSPRPAALDERGLPISIPSYIGDVRVANGRVTLYKNVQ